MVSFRKACVFQKGDPFAFGNWTINKYKNVYPLLQLVMPTIVHGSESEFLVTKALPLSP